MPEGFAAWAFGYSSVLPGRAGVLGGLQTFADIPPWRDATERSDSHAYQTFIAVQLSEAPRTQSGLESNR